MLGQMTTDTTGPAPARTPQGERTRAMRRRLLEATVDCLVELGWAGTTTTVVSERAGVSRGAQLHHFPSKQDLVVAAVEHLSQRRRDEMTAAAADLPAKDRTRAVLEAVAHQFVSPVFFAALELWVAARTDAELRRPWFRWSAGSVARPTPTPWSCSASTSPAATTARSCKPPSTCCAAWASPPRSATTAGAEVPCSTPGRSSSTSPWRLS